ncbi:MAG: terminase, partial [Mesorhizobium sp.]
MRRSAPASAPSKRSSGRSLGTEYLALLTELERRRRANHLAAYRPYPRQAQFHAAGAANRERLFMAGNQLG